MKLKCRLWIFPSLVIPLCESHAHLYLDPRGVTPTHYTRGNESFFFKLCTVIHTSLSEPVDKPTDILSGSALSSLQSPRKQCHSKLCWFWGDNVFCLRTAWRFNMKGCQCVRVCAFSLSVWVSAVGLPGACGRGSLGGRGWWRRCTSGVLHAVHVHNSSRFTLQAIGYKNCPALLIRCCVICCLYVLRLPLAV